MILMKFDNVILDLRLVCALQSLSLMKPCRITSQGGIVHYKSSTLILFIYYIIIMKIYMIITHFEFMSLEYKTGSTIIDAIFTNW